MPAGQQAPTPWPRLQPEDEVNDGKHMTTTPTSPRSERRVRLWFGPHLLHDYRAAADAAESYAEAIGKRFAGLTVTVDSETSHDLPPLPCEQLWTLTP